MRTALRFAVAIALLLALLVSAQPAIAAPTAADKETARNLVREGRVKKRRGDVQGALEDFSAAHAIMNVPTTGLELAKTQATAGKLVEAVDTLLEIGRMPASRRESRAFKKARTDAKKLAKELAGDVPAIRINVQGSAADGAEVSLDGRTIVDGTLGAPIKLNPGEHEIVAVNGEAEAKLTVDVKRGETRDVELLLDAPPEEEAPVAPVPAETTINPMVWVGFGVGAAGIIVGSVTGALAMSKFSEVSSQCRGNRCPAETHDDIDSGSTLGTVSTIGFIVGGVGVAAGIVGLFLPLEAEAEGIETALMIGPGGGSVMIGW